MIEKEKRMNSVSLFLQKAVFALIVAFSNKPYIRIPIGFEQMLLIQKNLNNRKNLEAGFYLGI
jgi:hypothetical protein